MTTEEFAAEAVEQGYNSTMEYAEHRINLKKQLRSAGVNVPSDTTTTVLEGLVRKLCR